MPLLTLYKINKSFGDITILKDISFDINIQDKIGIVGKNGAGKTTVANIIFGSIPADGGQILKNKESISVGYLRQSTQYDLNTFDGIFTHSLDKKEMKSFLENSGQLGLSKVQNWASERFHGLSGGEKTKLALAEIWAKRPDILILDEPTNHMDFKGIDWLSNEISKYEGTIIIISHDRYFLDRTVNTIVEIDGGCSNLFKGNYSFYSDEKRRRYESQLNQYLLQRKTEEKIQNDIDNLRGWSSKAHGEARKVAIKTGMKFGGKEFYRSKAKKMDRQIKSRIKRLEKLRTEGIEKPKEEKDVNIQFETDGRHGKNIIEGKDISKSYPGKPLFQKSSFYIQRGDRIGLLGINGCGKSTLLKIIIEQEYLDSGELWISPSSKTAYLSQDVMDLDEGLTTLDMLTEMDNINISYARSLLFNMGFDESMLLRPIKYMSLGERTRVKIAKLILMENDLLILDEPGNHLDLQSRESLEKTLLDYSGTIMLVSHDRYMLEKICTRLLIFENNKILSFEGGYKYYSEKAQQNNKIKSEDISSQRMLIENRISNVLGMLSRITPEDEEYSNLDNEFKDLIRKRRELDQLLQSKK